MWPTNGLTERLRLKWPILQAPMGLVTTPALAAAVSNAGGLGGLGMWGLTAEDAARVIAGFRLQSGGSVMPTIRCGRSRFTRRKSASRCAGTCRRSTTQRVSARCRSRNAPPAMSAANTSRCCRMAFLVRGVAGRQPCFPAAQERPMRREHQVQGWPAPRWHGSDFDLGAKLDDAIGGNPEELGRTRRNAGQPGIETLAPSCHSRARGRFDIGPSDKKRHLTGSEN